MNELDRIKALLRDDLYPGSKDWSEGSTLERVEWLLTMYQDSKEEIERLASPWNQIQDEFYK